MNRSTRHALMASFALAGATLVAGILDDSGRAFDVMVRVDGADTVVLVRASKCAPLLFFCHKAERKRP